MTDYDFDPASLDLANLREITDGEHDIEMTLFTTFITCGEESLDVLTNICADGEQTQWKEHSHSLKGEAANLGAVRLAQYAHDSQMAFAASAAEKQEILAKIKEEWAVVKGYLQQMMAE